MTLQGKKILLGVSGSIAAYKSVFLLRLLIKAGADVKVIMTDAATTFVGPLSFSTLSKHPVYSDLHEGRAWSEHVQLGLWADLMIIAPATCRTLSAMATGLCDNMLLAVYLSSRCPVWVAPAMDADMWSHRSTQRNLATLRSDGVHVIPVANGELASGLFGDGRMAEPEQIFSAVEDHFSVIPQMKELTALVTAGPTYEDIDPVRYIGNRSSGKMGIALAEALVNAGIKTHLVIGPTSISVATHDLLTVSPVRSAADMAQICQEIYPTTQVGIMAAAVADYTPSVRADQKIKKKDGDLKIDLKRTTDIAASLGATKRSDQILMGFALETENEMANAKGKLAKKNFDVIALNSLNDKGAGFAHDTNKIKLYFSDGSMKDLGLAMKKRLAKRIVEEVLSLYQSKMQA